MWLHGVQVARLSEPSPFRLRLDSPTTRLTSSAKEPRALAGIAPVQAARTAMRRQVFGLSGVGFVEGLLPEGNVRQHIASQAGLPVTDTMGLLERVGAECAGAVQFLPEGADPGPDTCAG